jgi:capsule biosynthesis phosphatase
MLMNYSVLLIEGFMKRLILDLDNTICFANDGDYENAEPNNDVIQKIREYKKKGFEIVISTSRNVRKYNGNVGLINANTLPIVINWLDLNDVPYDEVYIGKPWCGFDGFYVDDKSVRPSEFIAQSYESICELLDEKK